MRSRAPRHKVPSIGYISTTGRTELRSAGGADAAAFAWEAKMTDRRETQKLAEAHREVISEGGDTIVFRSKNSKAHLRLVPRGNRIEPSYGAEASPTHQRRHA